MGKGCSCCQGRTVVKGINDVATTHSYLVKYFKNAEEACRYSFGSNNKVQLVCPDCGFEKEMVINDLSSQGFSCLKCSDGISYPNKFAFKMLEELGIDFIPEYSPQWIKPKRYDFYFELNDKKYILEMDGGLGHGKRNRKSNMSPRESKILDDYKDKQAILHDIQKPIRIDCSYGENDRFQYIKNSLLNNKTLNELFNLNNVNWEKCHEFGLSSRIKEVCDLFSLGIYSMNEIDKMTKLGRNTIIRYLKDGNILKLCNYNSVEMHRKNSIITATKMGNPIMCITTGQVFNSPTECSRVSDDVFGIHMNQGVLNKYIKENKTYKGYDFKFITRKEYEEYSK